MGHPSPPPGDELSARLRSALGQAADPAGDGGSAATRAGLLAAGRARRQRRRRAGVGGAGLAAVVGLGLVVALSGPGTPAVHSATLPEHATGSSPARVAGAACVEVSVGSAVGRCGGMMAASAPASTAPRASSLSQGEKTITPTTPQRFGPSGTSASAVHLRVGQRLEVTLPARLGHWSDPVTLPATQTEQSFATATGGQPVPAINGTGQPDLPLGAGRLRRVTGADRRPTRSASFVAVTPGEVILRATSDGHRWTLAIVVGPAGRSG